MDSDDVESLIDSLENQSFFEPDYPSSASQCDRPPTPWLHLSNPARSDIYSLSFDNEFDHEY